MAASSTTRRGNGAGRGGPAKGAGWGGPKSDIPAGPGPGRVPGVALADTAAARARAILESNAEKAAQRVVAIVDDPAHPQALQAALANLSRIGVHDKAGIEHSGEGGGPVTFKIVTGVPRAE